MAEILSPLDGGDGGPFAHRGLPWQHRNSEAVAQRSLQLGGAPGLGYITCHGHDGCINSSPGSSVRGHTGFVTMVRTSEPVAHKPLGVFLALKYFQLQLEQWHVLICTDNMSVVLYINHQGGV